MAYNGRRGPNVSEYIANLNAIPTPQDLQNSNQDPFNVDDELAMFTNAQFFDFDLHQNTGTDLQTPNFDGVGVGAQSAVDSVDVDLKAEMDDLDDLGLKVEIDGLKDMDFGIPGDFSFPDFNTFTNSHAPNFASHDSIPPLIHPIRTNHQIYQPTSPAGSPASALVSPGVGEKRKADSLSDGRSPDFEEASRMAAEEDKRRRNTAASARFRVKKKQREQALERSAKDMSDKVAALEGRINQLETENKWLKNLITEKHESKEDIAALWKKYNKDDGDKKDTERKDGVGTEA
ncbi:hypothetical protein DSL72_001494 [Monilinia vaccinii-corymbosi]|uniref:BZIP domain-containing protein n=1 Tax=Monilinia vaccinii-corymbosi TaxID=61207 RepID=A0A8A3P210_9HELO|nr:hypothetical protein DSL72_001494 [Monilinia vaccinii-corymbosi]